MVAALLVLLITEELHVEERALIGEDVGGEPVEGAVLTGGEAELDEFVENSAMVAEFLNI